MPLICVGVDLFAEVDDEDWFYLTFLCSWSLDTHGHIQGHVSGKLVRMHKLIAQRMGLLCDTTIDHEDRNKLNNKRSNLRNATKSQNNANSKLYKNNTSGFKGVCWHKNRWYVQIRHNGKKIFIGTYKSLNEARLAYIEAARNYHKEFFTTGD